VLGNAIVVTLNEYDIQVPPRSPVIHGGLALQVPQLIDGSRLGYLFDSRTYRRYGSSVSQTFSYLQLAD
jgi:hypothetical protein